MPSIPGLITDAVALAGGRMVGRTRIQKTIYLLDNMGLSSGATFYYHNFGPFSDDVANGIVDEKFEGQIREQLELRQADGSPYSVFSTSKKSDDVDRLGNLRSEVARAAIKKMNEATSTVLELAATIHWLAFVEQSEDWRAELIRRKGAKTQGGRIEQAVALLQEFNLAPTKG